AWSRTSRSAATATSGPSTTRICSSARPKPSERAVGCVLPASATRRLGCACLARAAQTRLRQLVIRGGDAAPGPCLRLHAPGSDGESKRRTRRMAGSRRNGGSNPGGLLDLAFLVRHVLAHDRVVLLDFHLVRRVLLVLVGRVEVTGAGRRNQ